MSLNALSTATAGLAATQAAINVVSQNVANAGTAGYVKRTLSTVATGTNNSGVAVGAITRSFDAAALKQLRLETSGAAYTSTKAGIASQLDALYGAPGSGAALDGTLNTFTESLQELSANPTSAAARTTVVSNASALASQINGAAASVQNLRSGVEAQLGTDTQSASTILSSVARLNAKIQNTTDASSLADLRDQRDQVINTLSGYMDVQTVAQRDGTVSVLTQSGVTLVDRGTAATLTFDGHGSLNPTSSYSTDPAKRTVGTITATLPGGGKIDLGAPGAIRSGSLAAGIELRDQVLPQAQRQLDDLAGGLATALTNTGVGGTLNTTTVGGTTVSDTTITLPTMQPGNAVTFQVTDGTNTVRNVTLVASATQSGTIVPAAQTTDASGLTLTFDASGGPATYVAQIQTALSTFNASPDAANYKLPTLGVTNGSATASAATLTLTAGGKVVGAATASVTQPTSPNDLTTGYPQLALFTDVSAAPPPTPRLFTGSFDSGAQLTGFAQRISINPALSGNTAALTASSATDPSASGGRAQAIFTALTSAQQTFSSSSGIGGVSAPYRASVVGFAQDVIASQGAASANAAAMDNTQQTALSTAQGRFSAGAGVNIDQEMSNLIALQTAYGANARVLTAARDMLNQLLQI
ncbi:MULTISPECIES: flagellar hook-associated protein FlgK [unclassified Methylobacterium]|uniref:flagellar hook-associated protein FlgK n=1 Tax=unclassified Methylobacterium TaxID=2615210 RepID=UPI0011C1F243|nr:MULTISPECIES: flagellar hook-associated protein FlgK [unclassified Methylobacterium]QEE40483.1 flagellar hook-associated protein FlgK [Methylobacterium sp. WL1]TXN59191.1 flagellar hook-associated protein FlgK [Methylobacterium sp. WL2]